MGGRCAVAAAVVVWMGIGWGAGRSVAVIVVALGAALAFARLARGAPDRVGTLAVLLSLGAAALARGGASRAILDRHAAAVERAIAPRWVVGEVVDPPWRESGEPLVVLRLAPAAGNALAGSRVRLRLPAASRVEWGDRIEALARLERPAPRRNPGGGSARAAAAAQGIVAQGRAPFARVRPSGPWPRAIAASLARGRRALERAFEARLSAPARELVTPLVTGDRSALSPELGARLQGAGLTHLLALSGLHVVWLAAVARALAAFAGLGVRGRALAGAGCALGYLALAGAIPSLVRAVATELLAAAARLGGRAIDPVQALAVGTIALLALAPGWAHDLGFQLSCLATLGLVTVGPPLAGLARGRPRALRAIAGALSATLAAQVAVLPLLLARFHALPWTALAANLLAVPVCGLLLAAAWLGAAIELALPGASGWAFGACEVTAWAMRAIAGVAARAPLALMPTGAHAMPVALAAAGAVLLIVGLPGPRLLDAGMVPASRGRVAAVAGGAFAVTLAVALAMTAPPLRPPPGCWWLVALDVGQGEALALGFGDGWWLVDAGPRSPRGDAGERVVLPFLRWAGVRRVETLVLTHDDGDHTGGAPAVLRGVVVARRVVPPPSPARPGPAARFGGRGAARGDTLRLAPAVVVRWPPRAGESASDNAGSLVLEIGEGRGRALLAADVDSTVEESLVVAPGPALLKVAHHGSGSSSGARFAQRLRAPDALISCGRNSRFGHPHAQALERLAAAGSRVHRTDLDGALWFELSPAGARRIEWRDGVPHAMPHERPRVAAESGRLARPPPHW